MKKQQTGFTLIELAIVLVIIGLLLGGVLKGQELINSAKAKNIAGDLKNAQIFIYAYQDKFRAIPGDDAKVASHLNNGLPATSTTLGDARIDGAWDSTTLTNESIKFWEHVRLAGLSTGPTVINNVADLPRNADNGRIGVQSLAGTPAFTTITGMTGLYVVCSDNITGRLAKQIDTNLDDGETSTGTVRAIGTGTAGTGTNAVTSATVVDGSTYTLCMTF